VDGKHAEHADPAEYVERPDALARVYELAVQGFEALVRRGTTISGVLAR
jgi:hypothetical protein